MILERRWESSSHAEEWCQRFKSCRILWPVDKCFNIYVQNNAAPYYEDHIKSAMSVVQRKLAPKMALTLAPDARRLPSFWYHYRIFHSKYSNCSRHSTPLKWNAALWFQRLYEVNRSQSDWWICADIIKNSIFILGSSVIRFHLHLTVTALQLPL